MNETHGPDRRIRILRSGWRLASAQVAFTFAAGSLVLLGAVAVLLPGPTTRGIAVGVTGFFALLGLVLWLACRWLVVDLDAGLLRHPDGTTEELSPWRVVVAIGQAGQAVTGSGRPYRYVVWSLGALTDGVGPELLDLVERAARGEGDTSGVGLTLLLDATTGGFVPLVDAATEKRVVKVGERVGTALGIPFVRLEPEPVASAPDAAAPTPPPGAIGGAGI